MSLRLKSFFYPFTLFTVLLLISHRPAFAACTDSTLDWDSLGLLPGFPLSLNDHTVDFSITNPGGLLSVENIDFYGANGSAKEYGISAHLFSLGSNTITVEIHLTGDPSTVSFNLLDVDGDEDPRFLRQEVYTITGSFEGAAVTPALTPTSQMVVSGNTVRGYNEVAPYIGEDGLAPMEGVLGVAFDSPVDTITVTFSADVQAPSVSFTSVPGFAFDNLDIRCQSLPPLIPITPQPQAVPVPATYHNLSAFVVLLLSAIGIGFLRKQKART